MILDISKFENAETKRFWLHVKKEDGTLDYADHHTDEEIASFNAKIKAWEDNEKKGRKPALRKPSKPFRLLFKSAHSTAFQAALSRATFKSSAQKAAVKAKAKDNDNIKTQEDFIDKAADIATDSLLIEDERWREVISAMCVGWENLQDIDGNDVEFSKDTLKYLIYPVAHYHIYAQCKEAISDQLNFMQESVTHS
jgi:hypothetical protein